MTERLNGEDGLGAIYPAMANAVLMYDALGYPPDHPHLVAARRSIEKLLVIGKDEAYCQPCLSPVWDTALAAHALLEAGGEAGAEPVRAALDWLAPLQVLDVKGDWARSASRCAARRLGVPIRQSALSRSRRHRGGGDGDGPRGSRRRHRRARRRIRRRSPGRANGSRACRAATAPGPLSTPTTPTTISTTSRSPIMARCSTRRPRTSPRAASRCSPSSAKRARRARFSSAGSTRSWPIRRRTEAGSAAGA